MATRVEDIEQLRASGSRGATVAEAAAQVQSRHLPLICGVYSIYNTLVNLGYLPTEEVVWPPHDANPTFDIAAWRQIGLSDEACQIINLLPYCEDYSADVIRPFAKSFSYVNQPDTHARDPFYQEDERSFLPPRFLCLTEIFESEQRVLLYDILEGRLGSWEGPAAEKDPDQGVQEWMQNIDWQPASLLATYVQKLIDLDWIPAPNSERGLEEPPTVSPARNAAEVSILPPSEWYLNKMNHFRARQRIYRESGWPGAGYDQDEAARRIQDLEARMSGHQEALRLAETDVQRERRDQTVYYAEAQAAAALALTQFLQQAAGSSALTTPSFEECQENALRAWRVWNTDRRVA